MRTQEQPPDLVRRVDNGANNFVISAFTRVYTIVKKELPPAPVPPNLRASDLWTEDTQNIADLTMVYNYAADKQITAEQIAGDLLPSSGFTSSYDNGNRLTAWTRDGSLGVPPASATSTNNPSAQTWNYDNAGNWNSTARTLGNNTTTENRTHSAADQINTIAGNATQKII